MKIEFTKYQGTGNDFVVADNRQNIFPKADVSLIQKICDRKFGVGSDGLILLEDSKAADFDMVYYNPDGSSSFCGNGSRCIVHFAQQLGVIGNTATYQAIDGIHQARINSNMVDISLHDVDKISNEGDFLFLDTGSPHCIVFTDDVDNSDLLEVAHAIRYSDRYQENGINVNLVERLDDGIKMRTYERGVENETLSCGTGVTAAALSSANTSVAEQTVQVATRGGELSVAFTVSSLGGFSNIWLRGPVAVAFNGTIEV